MIQHTFWQPSSTLPLRAMTKGNEDYIWYEIVDRDGWEVARVGGFLRNHSEAKSGFEQVCYLLCKANGNNSIEIDGQTHNITWR